MSYYEQARKDAREAMGNLMGLSIKSIKFTKDDFTEFFDETLPQVSASAIQ